MPTVFEKIKQFNSNRLPELVRLKYAAMTEDAFRFYRGSCHLFFEHLAEKQDWQDPTRAWNCGDLHPENFGTFKGDNRVVYFDLNDFDEALLAPASWDVARMLTGIYIAGQVLLLDKNTVKALADDYMVTYIRILTSGKALAIEKETAKGLLKEFLVTVATRSEKQMVQARTVMVKGKLALRLDGLKFLALTSELRKQVKTALADWLEGRYGKNSFKVLDVAGRIAGTGSVGLQRYVVLVLKKETGNYHLIDIKEARPSSVQPYLKIKQPAWASEAERIIQLQSRMTYVIPAWLHTLNFRDVSFVVKELQPVQDKMDLALCKGKKKKLADILDTMARLNAAAQLRSAGRQGSSNADDLIKFAADATQWQKKLDRFAKQTAALMIREYEVYCREYAQASGTSSRK